MGALSLAEERCQQYTDPLQALMKPLNMPHCPHLNPPPSLNTYPHALACGCLSCCHTIHPKPKHTHCCPLPALSSPSATLTVIPPPFTTTTFPC